MARIFSSPTNRSGLRLVIYGDPVAFKLVYCTRRNRSFKRVTHGLRHRPAERLRALRSGGHNALGDFGHFWVIDCKCSPDCDLALTCVNHSTAEVEHGGAVWTTRGVRKYPDTTSTFRIVTAWRARRDVVRSPWLYYCGLNNR